MIYLCVVIVCQFTAPLLSPPALSPQVSITSYTFLIPSISCPFHVSHPFLYVVSIHPAMVSSLWSAFHLYTAPFTLAPSSFSSPLLPLLFFPSALYLLGAVLCPTHLNPLLSCVSVLCEVKKTPIFTLSSLFCEFHCDSQHYMPGTWTVSWLIAANFTSQCNFDIPNHHQIKTPKRIRLLDDLLESLDLVLAELHCFTFTQLFCILQTLKHYLKINVQPLVLLDRLVLFPQRHPVPLSQ